MVLRHMMITDGLFQFVLDGFLYSFSNHLSSLSRIVSKVGPLVLIWDVLPVWGHELYKLLVLSE